MIYYDILYYIKNIYTYIYICIHNIDIYHYSLPAGSISVWAFQWRTGAFRRFEASLVEELEAGLRRKLKQCQIPAWMVDDGALSQQEVVCFQTRAV